MIWISLAFYTPNNLLLLQLGVVSVNTIRVRIPSVRLQVRLDIGPGLDSVIQLEDAIVFAGLLQLLNGLGVGKLGAIKGLDRWLVNLYRDLSGTENQENLPGKGPNRHS